MLISGKAEVSFCMKVRHQRFLLITLTEKDVTQTTLNYALRYGAPESMLLTSTLSREC